MLFLHKCVVAFRGIMYISTVANVELTEINNKFKCKGGLIN